MKYSVLNMQQSITPPNKMDLITFMPKLNKIRPLNKVVLGLQQNFLLYLTLKIGTGEINTHSLLLRAADLLAQNEFIYVLESETFKSTFGKLNDDQVTRLHKKMQNYENCIKKCANHLSNRITEYERNFRKKTESAYSASSITQQPNANSTDILNSTRSSNLTNQNIVELENLIKFDFKERLKLWFDLCRIARKQQIWDICRVSAKFCMLYDNDQLVNRFLKSKETNGSTFNSLFDIELMRNIAEAPFIYGEVSFDLYRTHA